MSGVTFHAVCHNPACFYLDQVRQVRLPQVGVGLVAHPPVRCDCGWDVKITTPPAEPVEELGEAFLRALV